MTENFPRLLVATEFPPNASGGGPAIVRQMLRRWPAEKLFWWSCLADRDTGFAPPLNAHRVAFLPPRLYPHRRYRALKSFLLDYIWTPWAAQHFRRTIKAFRPDVIWVIPHCWSIPPLGKILPSSGIGFHVSMHDYPDIQSCIFRFGLWRSRNMAVTVDGLYASATTRDAISGSMLADLRSRTGCEGAVSRAGLEPEDFEYLENKTQNADAAIRIAHAGTIIVENAFTILVEALNRARRQLSKPVFLEFFGAHSYRARSWFDPSWMREHGLIPEPALSDRLKEFAWGFAPMSLTDDDPRYNRFSFPTKFVSYLAAGLPIITLGHSESSLVRMARAYPVGPCLTSVEPAVIEDELISALSIREPWAQFGSEIQRCSRAEFDAERMRNVLYENLLFCRRHTP